MLTGYTLHVYPVGRAQLRDDLGERYCGVENRIQANVVPTQPCSLTAGETPATPVLLLNGREIEPARNQLGQLVIPDVFFMVGTADTPIRLTVATRHSEIVDTGIDLIVYPFAVMSVSQRQSDMAPYQGTVAKDAPCLGLAEFDLQNFLFVRAENGANFGFEVRSFTVVCGPPPCNIVLDVHGVQYLGIREDRNNKVVNTLRLERASKLSRGECAEFREGSKERAKYVGEALTALATIDGWNRNAFVTTFSVMFNLQSCKAKHYLRLLVFGDVATVCPLMSGMICVTAPRIPSKVNAYFHNHRFMNYMSKDFAWLSAWFNRVPARLYSASAQLVVQPKAAKGEKREKGEKRARQHVEDVDDGQHAGAFDAEAVQAPRPRPYPVMTQVSGNSASPAPSPTSAAPPQRTYQPTVDPSLPPPPPRPGCFEVQLMPFVPPPQPAMHVRSCEQQAAEGLMPFESAAGTMPFGAAQQAPTTVAMPLDAGQQVATTVAMSFDAGQQAPTTVAMPLDAGQQVATTAAMPLDAGQQVATTVAMSAQQVPTAAAMPFGAVQQAPTTVAMPFDAGQQAPTAAAMPFDAVQQAPTTAAMPFGAAQQAPATAAMSFNAVQQAPTTAAMPFDAVQQAPTAAAMPFDAGQQVPTAAAMPFDAGQQVPTAAAMPFGAFQQAPTPTSIPIDAVQQALATVAMTLETNQTESTAIQTAYAAFAGSQPTARRLLPVPGPSMLSPGATTTDVLGQAPYVVESLDFSTTPGLGCALGGSLSPPGSPIHLGSQGQRTLSAGGLVDTYVPDADAENNPHVRRITGPLGQPMGRTSSSTETRVLSMEENIRTERQPDGKLVRVITTVRRVACN